MGILNVTPDSFSDGGAHFNPAAAVARGLAMVGDGADLIDVGGESTRPGASPVSASEEQARVLPVIDNLRRMGVTVPISIDTRNAATMVASLDAGATVVNDVSALRHDPRSLAAMAGRNCPVILMHMRGTPETMAALCNYGDIIEDVVRELSSRIERALAAGIARCRIAIDPGFGFAKNLDQNLALLNGLRVFAALGFPMVAGVSRKRFLGSFGKPAEPSELDIESVAAGLYAAQQGASVLRVHNVNATVRALRVWKALDA